MTTYRSIVREVSEYLVDQETGFEFTHWSEDEVTTYLQDALSILAMNLKHLFVKSRDVELVEGTHQQLGQGCEMRSVVGSVDRNGALLGFARRTSHQAATLLARPECAPSRQERGYTVRSYHLDPGAPESFYVSPPAPAGARVKVACFAVPRIDSLDEEIAVPFELVPVLKEFMLYYAYGQDTESVPARDYQKTHWANGVSLLAAAGVNRALVSAIAAHPSEVPV